MDVLAGDVSPAGRLPNTWPADLSQVSFIHAIWAGGEGWGICIGGEGSKVEGEGGWRDEKGSWGGRGRALHHWSC